MKHCLICDWSVPHRHLEQQPASYYFTVMSKVYEVSARLIAKMKIVAASWVASAPCFDLQPYVAKLTAWH